MKISKVMAYAIIAPLFAACSGNGSHPIPGTSTQQTPPISSAMTIPSRTIMQNGLKIHVLPPRGVTVLSDYRHGTTTQSTGAASNLLYNGGPIQVNPHVYVVFWGPSWSTSQGDPDGVKPYLLNFLSAVGGGNWLNSVTQYSQSDGQTVGNPAGILAGSFIDKDTPSQHVSPNEIAHEAAAAAQHFGDYSVNASYVVALPHDVTPPSGFGQTYCAWHGAIQAKGIVAFTNLPYMPDGGQICGAGDVNSPGILDGVSIVEGHEQAETETDPQLNAWYDSNFEENGDKCVWMNLEDNPDAAGFPTQPLWSNASSSCVQSYTGGITVIRL